MLPRKVQEELLVEDAPPEVRAWAAEPPAWISIQDARVPEEGSLERLHAGERAAILLAESVRAEHILLDEKSARRTATDRGLRVIGLLGVLGEAADRGLVDLPAAIERLSKTSFRSSPALLKSVLERFCR